MSMASMQKEDISSNIPHMHLFMYLKRRFPELKDADITDSIHKFGLDKIRCEAELTQKCMDHHRGYYSPSWNRSRASSQDCPLSPSDSLSQSSSPLQNCSSPSTPLRSQVPLPEASTKAFSEVSQGNSSLSDFVPSSRSVLTDKGTGAVIYSCASSLAPTSIASSEHYENRFYPSTFDYPQGCPNLAPTGLSHGPGSAPILQGKIECLFDLPEPIRRSSADALMDRERRFCVGPPDSTREELVLGVSTSVTSNPGSPSVLTPTSSTIQMQPHSHSSPVTMNSSTDSLHPVQPQQPSQSGALEKQRMRKERLKEELRCRMEEKARLVEEVESLSQEIALREEEQRQQVLKSKKEIELIQQDNSRLQFYCDEIERKILESGEAPKADTGVRVPSLNIHSVHRKAPPPPVACESSVLSLSSGGAATTTTPLIPTRKAPVPSHTSTTLPPEASTGRQGINVGNPRPATIGSDENGKEWACSKCTFINSPFLNECEICSFPHFSIGTLPNLDFQSPHAAGPSPGEPCYCHHRHHYNPNHERHSAGELQDIHIQVRHQNLRSPIREI